MSLQTVGRYQIVGELGRGAMGVVYKAQDPTIGRTVALKTMRLDVHGLEADDMLLRFQNEARAAGLLSHPNIVTIYDAGEHDGIFYIAMEFIEGTTLHELLHQRGILEPQEAIHLSREICKGLDYAHSHGIVHRDVKPGNVMITSKGAVKIMDFGIAKSVGTMTSTGQVLGTPNYMSPEQVKGRSLDGRSDLFSVGVILYEMLTGEKPFVGQNVTTIIYKIVHENPIPPRDLDATIPTGLSAIAMKALAKSPDERYQSSAELVLDLENYRIPGSLQAVMALPQSEPAPAHEKTVVLPMRVVAGSAVRVAEPAIAPAKDPVPLRQPATAAHSRRNGWIAFVLTVLLLGSTVGGYVFYRARLRMQQLQAEADAREAQAANSPSSAQVGPLASGSPGLGPEATSDSIFGLTPAKDGTETKLPFDPGKSGPGQAATHGELDLASEPPGAKVELDGQTQPGWATPLKITRLEAGSHNVVFSKEGYIPQTRTVESLAGKSLAVSVALAPSATMVVNSNPQGAKILVDGKDTGAITPSELILAKGFHQIIVRRSGYRDGFWEGTMAQNQTVNFSPILLSLDQHSDKGASPNFLNRLMGADTIPEGKGVVHIRTVPEGATIIVDGRVASRKSNARWPADPGVYSVDLQLEGYKTVHRNIQVQEGKIKNIDVVLEKQ